MTPGAEDDTTGASASVSFAPSPKASVCGFSLGLPKFKLLVPPALPPIALPSFNFYAAFKLSCDPSNPIDVTAGLSQPFGGNRKPNNDPDPDDDESGF